MKKTLWRFGNTRLWHYELLPYLPPYYFKKQIASLENIVNLWKKKGDKIKEEWAQGYWKNYDSFELIAYIKKCINVYEKKSRYSARIQRLKLSLEDFGMDIIPIDAPIFIHWHNKEYLRVCMAILYEIYKWPKGAVKITEEDWNKITTGYFNITGEKYIL